MVFESYFAQIMPNMRSEQFIIFLISSINKICFILTNLHRCYPIIVPRLKSKGTIEMENTVSKTGEKLYCLVVNFVIFCKVGRCKLHKSLKKWWAYQEAKTVSNI